MIRQLRPHVLPETELLKMFCSITMIYLNLFLNYIAYTDIKPDNIYCSEDLSTFMVSDFGDCRYNGKQKYMPGDEIGSTRHFRSPEI